MTRILLAVIIIAAFMTACSFDRSFFSGDDQTGMSFNRYDRLETRYLTTGDLSALQTMKTQYPEETRTLVENLLNIGVVNAPGINAKLRDYYKDSTLSVILRDVDTEFESMDDENVKLNAAFTRLRDMLPELSVPVVYTQVGDLGESIVVSGNLVGVSLDKYLGEDYSIYKKFYTNEQRRQMKREYIVPDCLSIYLLSVYPLKNYETSTQQERDFHVQCIWYIVNKALGEDFYSSQQISLARKYLSNHKDISFSQLLVSFGKE